MDFSTVVTKDTVAIFYFTKSEFDHGEAHATVTRYIKESPCIADWWAETWKWEFDIQKWCVRVEAWDPPVDSNTPKE